MNAASIQDLKNSAENGHLETVRYLIGQGANVHAEDDYALKVSAESEC